MNDPHANDLHANDLHANDPLDRELAASLHHRAQAGPTGFGHFGDVRRRVRRRRQRNVALSLTPALAGVAVLGTRLGGPQEPAAGDVGDTSVESATTWNEVPSNGNVLPFRCLDESQYDSSDGWTYYVTCEQLPPMTAPDSEELVVDTTWAGDATTTSIEYWPGAEQCGQNTLPPTTSPQLAGTTTTVDPRVDDGCGNATGNATTVPAATVPTTILEAP